MEAVFICTPNDTHAPIAIECLNAGKNVLCEKPASVSLDLVKKMKETADQNGKILNIGVVNRLSMLPENITALPFAEFIQHHKRVASYFRQVAISCRLLLPSPQQNPSAFFNCFLDYFIL